MIVIRLMKKIIIAPIDWFLYTVLSEQQKKRLAQLFTEEQKNKIKRITQHGKQQAQRAQVKKLKDHLYTLGFTDRALAELETLHQTSKDAVMQRLTAWELALWYTNLSTVEGADQALEYLETAMDGEKDADQQRRGAIIQAECLARVDRTADARQLIHDLLAAEKHPDLLMAAVNLEADLDIRVGLINEALDMYQLHPIEFSTDQDVITYDDLRTKPFNNKLATGPIVSIILPAYNAEAGIRIAIESILTQTWQQFELLVVDDCSTDGTVAVVKEYMEQDNRIQLFSTPENSGPYVARNIALQAAIGEYVTVNDADDWSHAEKIEIQADHLIKHEEIIANTSEHARLTEDLKIYRRGTPGIYIFPNMSSTMFRREPVLKELGAWDSVRFAADGEFKRRLLRVFGKQSFVDLPTGPLSLPRQSMSSLTGSSAFGYNGFFMGVRKEYVDSLEFHHHQATTFYYPYPLIERSFPVPEPMCPDREEKPNGIRVFDRVIAADFRLLYDADAALMEELKTLKAQGERIGLVQINHYDITIDYKITSAIRLLLDGDQIQMLVYGEKIQTPMLVIHDSLVLTDWQKYLPEVDADRIHVVVQHLADDKEERLNHLRQSMDHLLTYFGKAGTWHTKDQQIRDYLKAHQTEEMATMMVANEDGETVMQDVKS